MLLTILAFWSFLIGCLFVAGSALPSGFLENRGAFAGIAINDGPLAPRPFRRSIFDLQNDGVSWALYIQALIAMQNDADTSLISYYQIAGIHGRPFIPWNGVVEGPGTYSIGYCPHNSVLFLPWHRPYLVLFEQILISHAQAIAKTYPAASQNTYINAANNLRLPYWDWAAESPTSIPDIMNEYYVSITTPTGTQMLQNPLYDYKFHSYPLSTTLFPRNANDGYLGYDPQTLRDLSANENLANIDFMGETYNSFVKATKFDNFCSASTAGPSIELIHNSIHDTVGGATGHMTQLTYSAFDPIFWLHHVNVDRLFAIYQALYPSLPLTPLPESIGTFTLAPGSISTNTTPLEPFSSASTGQWYTSVSVWSTNSFGYTYPELEDWHQDIDDLRINVTGFVNRLYGKGANSLSKRNRKGKRDRDSGVGREWSVDLKVDKFGFAGERYVVRIFVGPVPVDEDAGDWKRSGSLMGSLGAGGMSEVMDKEGRFPVVWNFGEVGLQKGLVDYGIDGEDIEGTVAFLKGNLSWGVQKGDGTPIDAGLIEGLEVRVKSETVVYPKDITELPVYSDLVYYPDITSGKVGGWNGGNW